MENIDRMILFLVLLAAVVLWTIAVVANGQTVDAPKAQPVTVPALTKADIQSLRQEMNDTREAVEGWRDRNDPKGIRDIYEKVVRVLEVADALRVGAFAFARALNPTGEIPQPPPHPYPAPPDPGPVDSPVPDDDEVGSGLFIPTPLFNAHRKVCEQCSKGDPDTPLCVEGYELIQQDFANYRPNPHVLQEQTDDRTQEDETEEDAGAKTDAEGQSKGVDTASLGQAEQDEQPVDEGAGSEAEKTPGAWYYQDGAVLLWQDQPLSRDVYDGVMAAWLRGEAVNICRFDEPQGREVGDELNVNGTPTLIRFADGRETGRSMNKEIKALYPGPPPGERMLIVFTASWCQPCKQVEATIRSVNRNRSHCIVVVDVDKRPDAAKLYGVQSVPTIIAQRHKRIVGRHVGAISIRQLERLLYDVPPLREEDDPESDEPVSTNTRTGLFRRSCPTCR